MDGLDRRYRLMAIWGNLKLAKEIVYSDRFKYSKNKPSLEDLELCLLSLRDHARVLGLDISKETIDGILEDAELKGIKKDKMPFWSVYNTS